MLVNGFQWSSSSTFEGALVVRGGSSLVAKRLKTRVSAGWLIRIVSSGGKRPASNTDALLPVGAVAEVPGGGGPTPGQIVRPCNRHGAVCAGRTVGLPVPDGLPCVPDGLPRVPDGLPCVPDGLPCVPDGLPCETVTLVLDGELRDRDEAPLRPGVASSTCWRVPSARATTKRRSNRATLVGSTERLRPGRAPPRCGSSEAQKARASCSTPRFSALVRRRRSRSLHLHTLDEALASGPFDEVVVGSGMKHLGSVIEAVS